MVWSVNHCLLLGPFAQYEKSRIGSHEFRMRTTHTNTHLPIYVFFSSFLKSMMSFFVQWKATARIDDNRVIVCWQYNAHRNANVSCIVPGLVLVGSFVRFGIYIIGLKCVQWLCVILIIVRSELAIVQKAMSNKTFYVLLTVQRRRHYFVCVRIFFSSFFTAFVSHSSFGFWMSERGIVFEPYWVMSVGPFDSSRDSIPMAFGLSEFRTNFGSLIKHIMIADLLMLDSYTQQRINDLLIHHCQSDQ